MTFDMTEVRELTLVGDDADSSDSAKRVQAFPLSVLGADPPQIDLPPKCTVFGRDISDVRVQRSGESLRIDTRRDEEPANISCETVDLRTLTVDDLPLELSIDPQAPSPETFRYSNGIAFVDAVGPLPADFRFDIENAALLFDTRGSTMSGVASGSSVSINRLERLTIELVDSELRGGFVGERLEIDATNSTMNVCVPGMLVVRARENSRIEYRCSPETLDVEVDDTSEAVPVD